MALEPVSWTTLKNYVPEGNYGCWINQDGLVCPVRYERHWAVAAQCFGADFGDANTVAMDAGWIGIRHSQYELSADFSFFRRSKVAVSVAIKFLRDYAKTYDVKRFASLLHSYETLDKLIEDIGLDEKWYASERHSGIKTYYGSAVDNVYEQDRGIVPCVPHAWIIDTNNGVDVSVTDNCVEVLRIPFDYHRNDSDPCTLSDEHVDALIGFAKRHHGSIPLILTVASVTIHWALQQACTHVVTGEHEFSVLL